jgi:hypothetical protein
MYSPLAILQVRIKEIFVLSRVSARFESETERATADLEELRQRPNIFAVQCLHSGQVQHRLNKTERAPLPHIRAVFRTRIRTARFLVMNELARP